MSVGTGRQNITILFETNSFISENILMGTKHLYWILTSPSFAVHFTSPKKFCIFFQKF